MNVLSMGVSLFEGPFGGFHRDTTVVGPPEQRHTQWLLSCQLLAYRSRSGEDGVSDSWLPRRLAITAEDEAFGQSRTEFE